uniref:Ion transport peptide-like protein n=1 Tax=Anopheles christyi TaxID=43041 RepID=A0A182KA63_9DIPT
MCSRNLAISLALIIALVPLSTVALPHHSIVKRSSFFDIECKGQFNKQIFYRLDRICEDCYSLFREPQILSFCKKQCFTTDYFKGCIDALQLTDEIEKFKPLIKVLNGADPNTEGCFGTDYFLACVEALFLEEEKEKFMKWREMLGKKK